MNAIMNAVFSIRILNALKNWWWRISEREVCPTI